MAGVGAGRGTWGVFTAAAIAGVAASAALAAGGPILDVRGRALALLAVGAVAWAVGVAAALRLPGRAAVAGALVAGLALRLASLAGPPVLSDDLYRYAWDGRVQAAGTNPYRWAPAARAVSELREGWLWPDPAECAPLGRPAGCTRINRPGERTIYPPVAQAWFAAVYGLGGIDDRHKPWQLAGMATELALLALLPAALRAWGRDARWAALYALSPFPAAEVVNNGHVDGLAALLVVGGIILAARDGPWRWAGAGALVGAAGMVKLYPAVVLVAVVAAAWRRPRLAWAAVAGAGAVVAGAYLPHVVAVGARVLGYLPGYLREEAYATGERHLLVAPFPLPGGVATVLAAAALVAVAVAVIRRRPAVPVGGATVLGAALLAATPVQPWYAVVLLALATVAGAPAWAAVAAAGYPYFFAVILDWPRARLIGTVSYGAALVAVALVSRARRPRPGRAGRTTGPRRATAAPP